MTEITVQGVLPRTEMIERLGSAGARIWQIMDICANWAEPVTFDVDENGTIRIVPTATSPANSVVMSAQNEIHDKITKKMSAKGETYWDINVSFDSDSDVEDAIQRLKQIDTRMREEFI